MDTEPIRKLAESARKRGKDAHLEYQNYEAQATEAVARCDWAEEAKLKALAASKLNDAFYWFGHANAYNRIVAMVELATVVEDELDAEPTCP